MIQRDGSTSSGLTDPVILVLGDRSLIHALGPEPPQISGMVFAAIADLSPALLERVAPDVVLSALMAGAFDALDVGRRLMKAGFDGRYRVVCAGLPQPGAIRTELQQSLRGLDVDILTFPLRPSLA